MTILTKIREQKPSRSTAIKSRLDYPIIDTDVHIEDFTPALFDYIDTYAGAAAVDKFRDAIAARSRTPIGDWYDLTPAQRHEYRAFRPPWWARPAEKTLDLATAVLPELLYQRLDDLGVDFGVVFPNLTLGAIHFGDDALRVALIKAVNAYNADLLRPYADRLTPVAVVPLKTPQEGVEVLEHAVKVLGLKVALIPGAVRRPIKALAEKFKDQPDVARKLTWLDFFGLDSEYDYDPFWAKAVELGVPLTTHSGSQGWDYRSSPTNYQFNHIGHFAQASDAQAKSLFFGGVTHRFPQLRFGFLEGGAAWGAQLYNDLVWHWEKRNGKAVQKYNPAKIDGELLASLFREFGDAYLKGRALSDEEIVQSIRLGSFTAFNADAPENGGDEFEAAGINSVEDIRDKFVPNFYFGAETDDATVSAAFNSKVNALNVRLNAFWSSDIGHWDVIDQDDILANTWSLVERGALTEEDARDLTFTNPHRFYSSANPDFFKGTVIESKVGSLLKAAE